MPVDRQLYRDAMARLGAAVNVVTTANESGRHGFTASAVCSVTDDPATLLVCMNRGSRSREHFRLGGPLCVNVLATHQRPVSEAFATLDLMSERFEAGAWTTLDTGAPVLDGAIAAFDCVISEVSEVGTHSVLFCTVQAVRLGDSAGGLIYFGRDYHALPHAAA
ncbi:flavin reductase [Acetobacteraceae bacterium KSS8]|uniref:Flavin reductase n=1 Tax=Endosaccharibacter trunci TaxID=2812733 RepID=A0ABT1W552_9PROT|nr:flavin reductase [Acetobacteraceae bacterium KSS8]